MAGGLMTLVAFGQQNTILNGNPQIWWWKARFKKYANFGMQKFELRPVGTPTIRMTEESTFTFEFERNADLLVDAFLSIELPTIWSPILPPQEITLSDGSQTWTDWAPYEFKWIQNVGAQIIRQVELYIGGQMIQKYSGGYLQNMVRRDFNGTKRILFNEMTGQVPEVVDPANANGRVGAYPNAYFSDTAAGPAPSIVGRTLLIPINAFFSLNTRQAFPLCALQYNTFNIRVTLRPVDEWFQIRNVTDPVNGYPYIQPNFNNSLMQMYRFLQPPPDIAIDQASYVDTRVLWNTNIHLWCTYAFLDNEEREGFAREAELVYPIRTIREITFLDVTGERRSQLQSTGLVTSWMFYFQRNDVNLRNEWSNYTNWPYSGVQPVNVVAAPTTGDWPVIDPSGGAVTIGPGVNEDGAPTGLYINQDYTDANVKDIMRFNAILFDGDYREDKQPFVVYNYVDKYTRSAAGANSDGLLCYNFCLNTSPYTVQPSGAQNVSVYNRVEFEYGTITPGLDVNAQTLSVCDPDTGQIVGVNKSSFNIYQYGFNLIVYEEVFNQLIISSGNAALQYQLSS